jgi:hypothetical protein
MEDIIKLVLNIFISYGVFPAFMTLMWGIAFFVIYKIFMKRMESISDEISNKSLSKFNKKIELLFRDEGIRSSLLLDMAQTSINKKLEYFEKVYKLYFEYQHSWYFTKETPKEEIGYLWDSVRNMRIEIFVQSIYLGKELTELLIDSLGNMLLDMSVKLGKINNSTDSQSSINHAEFVSNSIDKAAKWLNENIHTNQTVEQYGLSTKESDYLKKEREDVLKTPTA